MLINFLSLSVGRYDFEIAKKQRKHLFKITKNEWTRSAKTLSLSTLTEYCWPRSALPMVHIASRKQNTMLQTK